MPVCTYTGWLALAVILVLVTCTIAPSKGETAFHQCSHRMLLAKEALATQPQCVAEALHVLRITNCYTPRLQRHVQPLEKAITDQSVATCTLGL